MFLDKFRKKNQKTDKTVSKPRGLKLGIKSWTFIILTFGFAYWHIFVIFLFGMLPTFIHYAFDKSTAKVNGKAIAFANIIGTFYVALPLFYQKNSQNIDTALGLLSEPLNIFLMYLSAGIGAVIVWVSPKVCNGMLAVRQEADKQKYLNERQKLIRQWGEELEERAPTLLNDEQLKTSLEEEELISEFQEQNLQLNTPKAKQ